MQSPNVLVIPACILIIDDDEGRIGMLRERLQSAFREHDEVLALGSMEWLGNTEGLQTHGPLRTVLVGRWKGWEQSRIREKLEETYPDVPFYFIDDAGVGNLEGADTGILESNPIDDRFKNILRGSAPDAAQGDEHGTPPAKSWLFRGLSGTSPAIQSVNNDISLVGAGDTTVLIRGNPGTGKEIVARNIHFQSPRRLKPFVPVRCGSVPAEQLEIDLFGSEDPEGEGTDPRKGRFELADGGTLFLDDIGDMPLAMQFELMRVLQERTFERVGGGKPRPVNVRIVAASHHDLDVLVAEGHFREDLHHRLSVFPIHVPDLRDRIEDLPVLIEEVQRKLHISGPGVRFTPAAFRVLARYSWPANLRELSQLIERLAEACAGREVDVGDLPPEYLRDAEAAPLTSDAGAGGISRFHPDGMDLERYLGDMERLLIRQALEETGGVTDKAARLLKLSEAVLLEKMHQHGIEPADFNADGAPKSSE